MDDKFEQYVARRSLVASRLGALRAIGDIERQMAAQLEQRVRDAVFEARFVESIFGKPDGATWGAIAEALDVSRQAAQQRFATWVDWRRNEQMQDLGDPDAAVVRRDVMEEAAFEAAINEAEARDSGGYAEAMGWLDDDESEEME